MVKRVLHIDQVHVGDQSVVPQLDEDLEERVFHGGHLQAAFLYGDTQACTSYRELNKVVVSVVCNVYTCTAKQRDKRRQHLTLFANRNIPGPLRPVDIIDTPAS